MRIATFVFAVVSLLLLAIATPANARHSDNRRCTNGQCGRPSTITRQTTRTATTTRNTVRRPAR